MLMSYPMRAPSKRFVTMTSILMILLVTLAWSLTRLLTRARSFEGVPALGKQKAGSSRQTAESKAPDFGLSKPSLSDADNDGIPDVAELHTVRDRDSFRQWFTSIAENQFYQLSDQWNSEQRDCAGLVRFAMREALRRHDRVWFQRMGAGYQTVAPDVEGFDLDRNPLGERIFRTDFGSFHDGDLSSDKFSEFADGRSLKNFNSVFVSRDRREAQPGDLLFFYQPWVQKFPYHVMIFLGTAHNASNGARDWVVYHTGSSPTDQGAVKKVELSVLDHHPDPRWRPVESNRNFVGFYRLKILQ
jgi:uncharacterized protein YfaT (DUF1175 family)